MSIQFGIIVCYFLLTIAVGLYASRGSGTSKSFHGAGLGVLMCVAAGTGEWLGGNSTTGIAEYGFSYGFSGAWFTIANGFGVIVLAIFFAKLYRSLDTVTVPGIIEKFIGLHPRILSSVLLTFVMIAVGTAQLIAAGTLGVTVLDLDYNRSVIIFGIGFIVYTYFGGMMAVGYTNILHLFFMYFGVLLAVVVTGSQIGWFEGISSSLEVERYLSMTSIGMPKVSSWIIASILGACTAQAGIQPLLAAKDVHVARKAAFITAFIIAPFGFMTAFLGISARIIFPELENAKLALPMLMMSLNPIVGGIVLAAIMAAILSTVSPIILASGTMITKDIYQRKLKPHATEKEVLRMSRITTSIAGVCCMVLAIALYGGTRILDLIYFAYSLRGALFIILLLGIYWKKVSEKGAVLGILSTAVSGFVWVAYKGYYGVYPISPYLTETYVAIIVALVSTVVSSIVYKKRND